MGWISGSWADAIVRGTAPETAGNWAIDEMPQWADAETVSATWAGGSSYAVLKGSKHPEEAAEFALWLNSDPGSVNTLSSIGYGWPSITDPDEIANLQDDPEVFAFYGGQDIWDVFAEADAAVAATWNWPPVTETLFASLTDNVKAAVEAGTLLTDAYIATQADSSPNWRTRASRSPSEPERADRPRPVRPLAVRRPTLAAADRPSSEERPTVSATTIAPPARRHQRLIPAALWVLLVPFLVTFAVFFLVPIGFATFESLFSQKSSGLGLTAPTMDFAGLDNYAAALSSPAFLASLGRLVAFRRSRCRSWSSPRWGSRCCSARRRHASRASSASPTSSRTACPA